VALKLLTIIFVWVAAWTPFCMILIIQMAGYDYIIHNSVPILLNPGTYLTILKIFSLEI
jgi:hypothetical protein